MAKNKTTVLIIATLAAGAGIWYYMKHKNTPALVTAPGAPLTSLPVQSAPPVSVTPLQIAPVPLQNLNQDTIDKWDFLKAWAATGSPAHVAMVANLALNDIPILWSIVYNNFDLGQPVTPAIQGQWNRITAPYGLA